MTVLSYTYYTGQIYGNSSIPSGITDVDIINGVSVGKMIYEYPIVVSDIVYFNVPGESSPPPQETESFPTVPVAVISGVTAMVIWVGLIVYYKKRQSYLVKKL